MSKESTPTQAVILAGGKGERLMPLTADRPKAMVLVAGRPFLEYLVRLFKANGMREILILVGYRAEKIKEYFVDGHDFGISISYSYAPPEVNHGKRLELALPLIHDIFLLHKCDIYWPLDLKAHVSHFHKLGLPSLMTVYRNLDCQGEYGNLNNIRVNKKHVVERYDTLTDDPFYQGHDIGFYLFKKSVIQANLPSGNFSLHDDLLSNLAQKGLLSAFQTDINSTTITNKKWLNKSKYYLRRMFPDLVKNNLDK